jgi:hypothetical protein
MVDSTNVDLEYRAETREYAGDRSNPLSERRGPFPRLQTTGKQKGVLHRAFGKAKVGPLRVR